MSAKKTIPAPIIPEPSDINRATQDQVAVLFGLIPNEALPALAPWIDNPISPDVIAKSIGVSRQTVHAWKQIPGCPLSPGDRYTWRTLRWGIVRRLKRAGGRQCQTCGDWLTK